MASKKRSNKKQKAETKQLPLLWIIAIFCFIVAAVVVTTYLAKGFEKEINNFETCKDAGGGIADSYPEQCFIDGKSFTNDNGSSGDTTGYVGLAERAALDKADAESKASRVVERDGEFLPVTADYSPGRLNFYVKNGKVYKVQVEGEEN